MSDSYLSSFPLVYIQSILAGKIQRYSVDKPFMTAIDKKVLSSPAMVNSLGISSDEQSDTRYHGGVDKALHHYPYEHYAYWKQVCGDIEVLNNAGAFGENISTLGMTEQSVCLGDLFAWVISLCWATK